MNNLIKQQIKDEFSRCIFNALDSVQNSPISNRPFHDALLPKEIVFYSAFERSFSTSFGIRTLEAIAEILLKGNPLVTDFMRQKQTIISIDSAQEEAIHSHVKHLRETPGRAELMQETLSKIRQTPLSNTMNKTRIISDLWWVNNNTNYYVSLKTVKPNIDQTAVARTDCLYLSLADPNCHAFFALPYNPYGETQAQYAFNPPMKVMNLKQDPWVLIGCDFWDLLGGEGSYHAILEIARKVGKENKQTLKKMLEKQKSN